MGIDVWSSCCTSAAAAAAAHSECELCRTCYFDTSIEAASATSDDEVVSWIKPSDLKLEYRVGRGQFGDTWFSSSSSPSLLHGDPAADGNVAVKVLPVVAKDMVDVVLRRFESILVACRGIDESVSSPYGISIKHGKICVVSKLYEDSVGGKMSRLPENKLPLSDALRYGADIARSMIELHSRGIMSLNLKPCNFLLDDRDRAVIGDYRIPLLFSGFSHSKLKFWSGTPNYMAPEQWNVPVRGPIAYETDSWGFGCSLVEMITGREVWEGLTPREIYTVVVLKGMTPCIPHGLPVAVQRILEGCFEYDYRDRPGFCDILSALTSPDYFFTGGDWVCVKQSGEVARIGIVRTEGLLDAEMVEVQLSSYDSKLYYQDSRNLELWKEPIQVGDHVRVKSGCTTHETEGRVVEVDTENVVIGVRFCGGAGELWEGSPDELEPVSCGIAAGDWVHRLEDLVGFEQQPSCLGIVHNVRHDGEVQVAFVGHETLWTGPPCSLARISAPFAVGQLVQVTVASPRFGWPCEGNVGRIVDIMPNGCLLLSRRSSSNISSSRGRKRESWWSDPAEVELLPRTTTPRTRLSKLVQNWQQSSAVFALGFLAGALGNALLRSPKNSKKISSVKQD